MHLSRDLALQFTYSHYRYWDMELEIKVHYKLGVCTILGAPSLYVMEQLILFAMDSKMSMTLDYLWH